MGQLFYNDNGTLVNLSKGYQGPQGPIGDTGPQGPQGPPGAITTESSAIWVFASSGGTVDPGTGNVGITGTGSNPRTIALSKTDADGTPRNLSVILPGDNLTITDDPQTPPITGFARYVVLTSPVDQGAWWQLTALRGDTTGSQTPAPGTRLRIIATMTGLGSGGSDGFTYMQDTEPVSDELVTVKDGQIWFDTGTGNSYVYVDDGTSAQWVQFAPGSAGGVDIKQRSWTSRYEGGSAAFGHSQGIGPTLIVPCVAGRTYQFAAQAEVLESTYTGGRNVGLLFSILNAAGTAWETMFTTSYGQIQGITIPTSVTLLRTWVATETRDYSFIMGAYNSAGGAVWVTGAGAHTPEFTITELVDAEGVGGSGVDPAAAPVKASFIAPYVYTTPTAYPGTNGNRWLAPWQSVTGDSGLANLTIVNGHQCRVGVTGLYEVTWGWWSEAVGPSFVRLRSNGGVVSEGTSGKSFVWYLKAGDLLTFESDGGAVTVNDAAIHLTDLRRVK